MIKIYRLIYQEQTGKNLRFLFAKEYDKIQLKNGEINAKNDI
tara:strand:+ start:239 stop:364 length:126 start_codon:yes stop_codon:yes gene_type:complete